MDRFEEPTREKKMKETKCRSCGCRIAFVKDNHGKTQVLDLSSPVYWVQTREEIPVEGEEWEVCERARSAFVSHFKTCPDVSKHSKKGKDILLFPHKTSANEFRLLPWICNQDIFEDLDLL